MQLLHLDILNDLVLCANGSLTMNFAPLSDVAGRGHLVFTRPNLFVVEEKKDIFFPQMQK